jgi:hypothetical protein
MVMSVPVKSLQYTQQGRDGKMPILHQVLIIVTIVLSVSFLLVPLSAAVDGGLTRGSRFTITITGTPNTPYYIWLTRTFSMSGEPGNQPPVIVSSQQNIEKDPPDGPYPIGSYQFSNGGGRTIRDDVTPSTSTLPSTQYYALVTTDKNGQAVVAFQTSVNTAMKTFSVKVENPQSVAKSNILVQRGDVPINGGAVVIGTVMTVLPSPIVTIPAPPLPIVTQELEITIPVTTPPPATTPPLRASMESALCIIAGGLGLLGLRREF